MLQRLFSKLAGPNHARVTTTVSDIKITIPIKWLLEHPNSPGVNDFMKLLNRNLGDFGGAEHPEFDLNGSDVAEIIATISKYQDLDY